MCSVLNIILDNIVFLVIVDDLWCIKFLFYDSVNFFNCVGVFDGFVIFII